jgi:hypothetical protein
VTRLNCVTKRSWGGRDGGRQGEEKKGRGGNKGRRGKGRPSSVSFRVVTPGGLRGLSGGAQVKRRGRIFNDLFFLLNSAHFHISNGEHQTSPQNFCRLFFTHFCYFQLCHLILIQPFNRRQAAEHYDRISLGQLLKNCRRWAPGEIFPGRAQRFAPGGLCRQRLNKNFLIKLNFPGGPNASPGGGQCPPGRMPE